MGCFYFGTIINSAAMSGYVKVFFVDIGIHFSVPCQELSGPGVDICFVL